MSDTTPHVRPPDEAPDKAADDDDVEGHVDARSVENGEDDLNPPRR
jgi:hypothetical protein